MKKSIVVLAIGGAALVAPAFAQQMGTNMSDNGMGPASLTLYGRAQVYLRHQDADIKGQDASNTFAHALPNGSSYIGVRGNEPITNGLNAVFRIETTAGGSSGVGLGNRYYYFGVESSAGTFTIGRNGVSGYNAVSFYDLPAGEYDTNQFYSANYLSADAAGVSVGATRAPYGIFWQSPNWGGVTVGLNYSPDLNNSGLKAPAYDFGVKYDNGGLKVGLGYSAAKTPQATTGAVIGYDKDGNKVYNSTAVYNDDIITKTTLTQFAIGYGFEFSNITLDPVLLLERATSKDASGNKAKYDHYGLNVALGVGTNDFNLFYSKLDPQTYNDNDIKDAGNDQFGLEYAYNLSKRTSFIASAKQVDNEKNAGDNSPKYFGLGLSQDRKSVV